MECGWDRKSDAVRRIVADLALATDAVAFVDDDLYERAEVSFRVPEALVLSPEDMADAVGWPEFSPTVVTAEARRRGEMYAERRLAGGGPGFRRVQGRVLAVLRHPGVDRPATAG